MPANKLRASLNALRAFESTARLRSMSAAAEELCVTHGAVSRHIRSLEETFGVTLLNRGAQSTDPTPEGTRLADGLSTAFDLIHASVEYLKPGPLTISCSASIMMYWLIPRIADFHARHPNVEIQFNMNYDQIDFARDNISIAIRNSTIAAPRNVIVRELVQEWIGPVCAPDYMKSVQLQSPKDLSRVRLLCTKTRTQAWSDWASASGYQGPELDAKQWFEHFYLLIQAATCGLGVASVPRMLVRDDLRSGKLVAPFGFVPGPRRLVLWIALHVSSRNETTVLANWLAKEMIKAEADAEDGPINPRPNAAKRQSRNRKSK